MRIPATLFIISLLVTAFSLPSFSATPREPAVAGTFYPADSTQLRQLATEHLNAVENLPEIDGQIIALIVPHAGLVYSGPIAAYAYKLLENRDIENVILCGPSHHHPFQGLSVYGPYITWQTPLGTVPGNRKLGSQMIKFDKRIDFIREAHVKEHSLEVQLPYLQTVLDNFQIVPVAMGRPEAETIQTLTNALKLIDINEKTIMVASTDWQHYRSAKHGYKMDSVGLACLTDLDPIRLKRNLAEGRVEMCGGGVVVAVMQAAIAYGADKVKLLKYGDSGDITGDKNSVVGYAAAVIYKSDSDSKTSQKQGGNTSDKSQKSLPDKFELSDNDKSTLLEIARESIESYLKDRRIPDFEVSRNLQKWGAGFVTLEKNGQLRGCIGHTSAVEPLYKTISTCAVQAAFSDSRFPPVTKDEIADLHIEISVLTPMQKVDSFDEIEVGRDGLMIFRGNSRGLLLPQVAVDYGWDRTTFLEQTCRKAGLPLDSYKDAETLIYKFQAVIFEEQ